MVNKDKNIYTEADIASFFKKKEYKKMQKAANSLLKRSPNNLDALNALGLAHRYLGDTLKSQEIFIKLMNLNPKKDYMYSNAGNLFFSLGNIDKAIICHQKSLELNPNNYNSLNLIGLSLSNKGKNEEAVEYFKRSIAINKKIDSSYDHLGDTLRVLKRYREASEAYNSSIRVISKCNQLECLYLLGDKDLFYEKLTEFKKYDIPHPLAATLCAHAAIRYNTINDYSFCKEPFDYIKKYELLRSSVISESDIKDFIVAFDSLSVSRKTQPLLKNGYQSSGNIFLSNIPEIRKMKKLIEGQINLYRENSSKKAAFISRWPKNYELHGWLIVMSDGGRLSGHMHKEGWLSGSLYLERPKKNNINDGDIAFSLHGSNYPQDGKDFEVKKVSIEKGDMVLFPSSLFHATFPFSSESNRVTLAFDIIPKQL